MESTSSNTATYLRRYTDLPALLHLLTDRKLTLLDPKTWDDKNDAYFISLYKEKKKLRSVLGLCFSQTSETYHHWRVFSNGPAGVCIVFDRETLLAAMKKVHGLSAGSMNYMTLADAKTKAVRIPELPFLKRSAFKPEKEFRAIFESVNDDISALNVDIPLSCIRSVSLSPWMHSSLSVSTVAAIRSINGCAKLKVYRSTLISNEQWKAIGRAAS
jgi:hypothetical protein